MRQRTEDNEFTQQHAYRVLAQLIRMRRRYTKRPIAEITHSTARSQDL